MPHYCWWYWRIYKRQDYANVERGLYVKIIHVNYEIFTKGSRQYPGDNVKRQIDVIGGWVGLTMTPLTLCWNDMSTFFTARYAFITTLDVILMDGWVRNITSIWRFVLPRRAPLMDCGLQLSLLLTTVSEVLNTYIKHCFLVNSAFLLPFCATLALVCIQLGTGLEIL